MRQRKANRLYLSEKCVSDVMLRIDSSVSCLLFFSLLGLLLILSRKAWRKRTEMQKQRFKSKLMRPEFHFVQDLKTPVLRGAGLE